jgi:hypothetical protein
MTVEPDFELSAMLIAVTTTEPPVGGADGAVYVRGDCPDDAVSATNSTHLPEHAGVLSSTHRGNELLLHACLQDNYSR